MDIAILKNAHHFGDHGHLANIGQEFIAQAFAGSGALDQAGDVDKLHDGGNDLFASRDFRKGFQARVRHGDNAHRRIDGAERIIFRRHRTPS